MNKIKTIIISLILLIIPIITYAEVELVSITTNNTNESIITKEEYGYDFSVTFTDNNQEIEYIAKVKNTNEEEIKVKEVIVSNPENELLEYSYSGIQEGDILKSNQEKEITIKLKTKGELTGDSIDSNFLLTVNYDKNDEPVNPKTGNSTRTIVIVLLIAFSCLMIFLFSNNKLNVMKPMCIIFGLILLTLTINTVYAENNNFIINGRVQYKHKYTVSVDLNGGTYNNSTDPYVTNVIDGEKIDLNGIQREYYNFIGFKDKDNNIIEGTEIIVDKELNLTAQWERIKYTVSIDPNKGIYNESTSVQNIEVDAGEYYTVLTASRENYEFVKWEINPQSVEINNENKILVDKNISIKALWNEQYVTLNVNPNGGLYRNSTEVYVSSHVAADNDEVTIDTPSYEGKNFVTWTDEENSEFNAPKVTMSKNRSLKAVWEGNTYTISLDPNGGTYNNSSEKYTTTTAYNTIIDIRSTTRDGYIFKGFKDNDTEVVYTNEIPVRNNMALTAQWVEPVCRIGEVLYETIMSAEESANEDDVITLLKSTEEEVTNSKKVTIDLNGKTITGSITNTSTGDLTIKNGYIENPNGTAIINNGVLTMGINDLDEDGISNVETNSLGVIGKEIGIKQNGTFNYYDGYIEGDIALDGGYDDSPHYRTAWDQEMVYYYPIVDHNNEKDCQRMVLGSTDLAVTKTSAHGDIYYYDVRDNINSSAITGYTMYAVRDFSGMYPLTIEEDTEIVFDLSGYNVTFTNDLTNDGTLTIKDSKEYEDEESHGILSITGIITNNDMLNIQDINIKKTSDTNLINNNNTLDIKNSTLESKSGYTVYNKDNTVSFSIDENTTLKGSSYTIYNPANNTITLTKGIVGGIDNYGSLVLDDNIKVFSNNSYINNNGGTIEINDGEIEISNTKYVISTTGGTVTINDGTIRATGISEESINCLEPSNVTINGGELYLNREINVSRSTFTMNGGTIEVTVNNAIFNFFGTINVNNGTIKGKTSAISTNYGTINITGGKLEGSSTTVSAGSNTVTISGGEITGGTIGFASRGNVTITGGKIEGSTYGAQITGGTVTIGNKNDAISTSNPEIKGETYGLYITAGVVNFYDGVFKGKTSAYYGAVTEIIDGTEIKKETTDEYENAYLVSADNFLEVNGTGYNSFVNAFTAVGDTGTINVIATTSTSMKIPTIGQNKDITFNLNDNQLTISQPIVNEGKLTIVGDDGTGTLISSSGNEMFINNTGTLKINSGKLSSTTSYINNNGGTIEINDGEIEISNTKYVISTTGGTVTINDGTIRATGISEESINCLEPSNVTINGGELYLNREINVSRSTFTMNGGTIEVTVNNAIFNFFGTINVNNGTIKGKTSAISTNYGTINITGGKLEGSSTTVSAGSNTVTISGGEITGGTIGFASRGNVTITGGKIEGSTYGAQITGGTVTIGNKNDAISTSNPEIKGETYGLYITAGVVNFYDGVFKGKTSAYYGIITSISDNSYIYEGTEILDGENYCVGYLDALSDYIHIKRGDDIYDKNNLYDAIQFAIDGDTIFLTGNIQLFDPITISKKINIDLKGFSIQSNVEIINNSELTITNSANYKSSISSMISSYLITNNNGGILILENIELESQYVIKNNEGAIFNGYDVNITSTNTAINNLGQITIDNFDINGASYGIYFSSSQENSISNSDISSNNYPFYNNSNSQIDINNTEMNGYFVNNNSASNITIVDSSFSMKSDSGNTQTILNKGTLSLNNSNVESYTYVTTGGALAAFKSAINNSGTLTISNESNIINNFGSDISWFYSTGIYNTGSVTFSNSYINIDGNKKRYEQYSYGIYNLGTTSIFSGSINVKGINTYGIYLKTGTITLGVPEAVGSPNYGKAEADVNIESPLIESLGTSNGIGIKNDSQGLSYYDGKIVASSTPLPENPNAVEYLYEPTEFTDEETGYKYVILKWMRETGG